MLPSSPELFPYMFWAQSFGWASAYSLAASGMPAPDPELLGPAAPLDLGPPNVDALPAFQGRLAELFGVEPERVVIAAGASGVMHLLAMRFFPGAHIVTEVPSYEPFRSLAAYYGSSHAIVPRSPDDGFAPDLLGFEDALAGRAGRPGHLFLSTPHNPSGVVTSADAIQELARQARAADGILISNEAYMEFAPAHERVHAALLAPNAISIGTLTKAYGLGALRLGWAILGEDLLHERTPLIDHAFLISLDPPTPCLRAGVQALENLEALLQPARTFEARCRPHLVRWLAECERVDGHLEPLGLVAFPRVMPWGTTGVTNTLALARFLADEFEVDVVPGEYFGLPGHIRVGYGVPEATLVTGLERLTAGLHAFGEH